MFRIISRSFSSKSTRAQAAETKKPITIGPFVECCPPGDLQNRVNLIPLAQARMSRRIKLRTVIPSPELDQEAYVGLWNGRWDPIPETPELSSGTSTPDSSVPVTPVEEEYNPIAETSFEQRILDYYVCHRPLPPSQEPEDSMLDLDQSALFDELEEMCAEPVVKPINIPEIRVVPAEPVAPTSPRSKRRALVTLESTLIPLNVAMGRVDIRYRPEGFEMD